MADDVQLYEGAEKTLRVLFGSSGVLREQSPGSESGRETLVDVTRTQWAQLLEPTGCTILSELRTSAACAYVLSESSLFVAHAEVMVKTCGQSHLLALLAPLLELARGLGLTPRALSYGHKAFACQDAQPAPYCDAFAAEIGELDAVLAAASPAAAAPTAAASVFTGPGDTYWVYHAAWTAPDSPASFTLPAPADFGALAKLEIMLVNPDTAALAQFDVAAVRDAALADPLVERPVTAAELLDMVPPARPVPGAGAEPAVGDSPLAGHLVDAHVFDPCGYSFNALGAPGLARATTPFATVHVTPNAPAPYLSFETSESSFAAAARALPTMLAKCRPQHALLVVTGAGDDKLAGADAVASLAARHGYAASTASNRPLPTKLDRPGACLVDLPAVYHLMPRPQ
ncbi:S-adenosylmethionine decarboxylase [Thecamonas trahens ATCC 50062]|uniref:S-adenosylmethionine decarboxylase n=1 Tax=Thecamonas trahens ATCC 50062 TaxID=461836 RepID=A0A0L0D250_THETB|nr:S-adenosylmethionine decarboxylase [Thecamonas trahens ATCC 50062]KNC46357.1 S-adenosylmethionine decarboxylase [Thecamonas trahens ATCC 50062]|eukprot:XP_013760650.1 S-adenosylmethionine decarboxylase [Thecamonas trahens ATCC 50062]